MSEVVPQASEDAVTGRLTSASRAVVLAAAAAMASCTEGPIISSCLTPTLGEKGVDGGPDPCHCDPPPELNITSCGCMNGDPWDEDAYRQCMVTWAAELDAGFGEGGPLPGEQGAAAGCSGECWPPPPDYWTSPVLLWFGVASQVPPCPLAAPVQFYNGYAGNIFAMACASGAAGVCSGLLEVCGPIYVQGFAQCVMREDDVDCPPLGPYTAKHVYDEKVNGQPLVPTTFCCLPAPLPPH